MNLISHVKKNEFLLFDLCDVRNWVTYSTDTCVMNDMNETNKLQPSQSLIRHLWKTHLKSFMFTHPHTHIFKHSFDHFTQRIYNYSIMYFSKMNCNELWPTPCCVINLSLWSHAHPSPSYWRSGNIIVLFSFLFQLWYCKSINLHCNDANDTVRDMSVWENSTHDVKK